MKDRIMKLFIDRQQAAENLNDELRGQAIFSYEFEYLIDEILEITQ
jgi:hypothetical protein